MDRKVLGAKQKNILMQMSKEFIPVMFHNKEVFVYDSPVFRDFCELVEADCDTLCRLSELYSGEIAYSKEDGRYIVTCLMKKDSCILENLSVELESKEDFLGLYSKEADTSLENFFNDSLENVVRKLKETYPDVVTNIEQNVISNIRDYDLEDSDKEYFAESYIEDNPVSSVETAESYLSDDDKKRFIIGWVDNL